MSKSLIKDLVSGILIGIANVIPGVSGGSIAFSLGIFDKLIRSVNSLLSLNFFRKKNEIIYLLRVGVGLLFGIFLFAKIVLWFLENYNVYTLFFFIGLILASVPSVFKEIKDWKKMLNYIFFLLGVAIIVLISFLKPHDSEMQINIFFYFKLFLMGVIGASSMVLPGISGSFVLLVLGFYKIVMTALTFGHNPYIVNIKIIVVFGFGVAFGIIFIVKLITILFEKFKDYVMFFILGLVLGSIYIIWPPVARADFFTIFLCVFSSFLGFVLVLVTERI